MKPLLLKLSLTLFVLFSYISSNAQISIGDTVVCSGYSGAQYYLCDSIASSYSWNVSPTPYTINYYGNAIQIVFNPSTNYTITVNTISPTNTYTLAVRSKEAGYVNLISDQIECSGDTINAIHFTTTPPGLPVYWNCYSNHLNYIGIPSSDSGDIVNYITPVRYGGSTTLGYMYVHTFLDGCGSDSMEFLLRVAPLPIVTSSNNTPICEGDTLKLFSLGGLVSYAWTGPLGFSSGLQNPLIPNTQFSYQGEFIVSATDMNGCIGMDTTNVTINPSKSINGTVYLNNIAITAGQVGIYSVSQGTTDTTNLNASGQYTFTSVPAGDYIIKCIPDSLTYPNLIGTYYGDVAAWNLADTIHHDCSANSVANINVIEQVLMTGPGTISGTIIEGVGFGSRLINSNNEVQVPGGPLKDIVVNLVSLPTNTVVAQTISDFNGYFEFSNVAVGDYTLQIDILGLPMDSSYYVVITPLLFSANVNQTTSSVFTNLDFVADGTAIYIANSIGIKQNENKENLISVYPNPAKNCINIKLQSGNKINGQIEIIDNLGKIVATQNVNSELTQVDIENLNSGIYFIKVKSEVGVNSFRLIKQPSN